MEIVLSESPPTYFKRYFISDTTLKKFDVHAVKSVFRNGLLHSRSTKDNPIIAYAFPSGNVKLYRPLTPERKKKWYGNTNALDVAGWTQLPRKGSLVLITKSTKDVMVLHELGFPAISFNGESVGTGKVVEDTVRDAINSLKKRFRHVVLLYDNDTAGRTAADKLSDRFKLKNISLMLGKDISDTIQKHKPQKTFTHLKRRLSQCLRKI